MFTETITYTNFADEKVTEEHMFHLSKAEMAELELQYEADGGMSGYLEKLLKKKHSNLELLQLFKVLVRAAYGKKSEDGRRFQKNDEFLADFMETGAYDEFLFNIMSDEDKASSFFNKVVPSDIAEQLAAIEEANPDLVEKIQAGGSISELTKQKKPLEQYSRQELLDMSNEDFDQLTGKLKPMEMPQTVLQVAMQRKTQQA